MISLIMCIAIAGFMHESNTFNPTITERAAFASQSLVFGNDLIDEWRGAHHEVGGFFDAAKEEGFEPPDCHGLGNPGRSRCRSSVG